MSSTETASDTSPQRRLLPSRWAELGARAVGWLFGGSHGNGDSTLEAAPKRGERPRAVSSATDSDSARKLRFWFTERNRGTL